MELDNSIIQFEFLALYDISNCRPPSFLQFDDNCNRTVESVYASCKTSVTVLSLFASDIKPRTLLN